MPLPGATITFPMLGDDFSICPSEYFTLFGLKIHFYGVIIMVGLVCAVIYIMARKEEFGLTEDNIYDMLFYVVPIGIVGARLFYVVFNFPLYKDNIIDAFKIWEGGLAIYGGIIFGVLGAFIFSRVKKIPFGAILDICGFGVIIGQIFGRWGNFINREAYGGETDIFCRMGLTPVGGSTIFVHPTFLYESLWNLVGFVLLHIISKKHRKFDGEMFALYATWYGLGRAYIEGLRTDSLYIGNTGIRVSQVIGALAFVGGVIYLIIMLRRVNKSDKSCPMLYSERKALEAERARVVTSDGETGETEIENEN